MEGAGRNPAAGFESPACYLRIKGETMKTKCSGKGTKKSGKKGGGMKIKKGGKV